MLRCCWLGGRKGIRPVQNWVVECWHGYLSGVRCRFAYGPADPIATHCLLLQTIQIGFCCTFLVAAYLGSPGQNPEGREMVVVVFDIQFSLVSYFYINNWHSANAFICSYEQVSCLFVVDVRDALVGVGLILNENDNFCFDRGLLRWCIFICSCVVCMKLNTKWDFFVTVTLEKLCCNMGSVFVFQCWFCE